MSLLLILSIALSTTLILSLGNIKDGAKKSLGRSISDVDLIVGAKTSDLNLLLHSVFKIGRPNDLVNWETYQSIKGMTDVKWTVPISLGDSHLSYSVLATSPAFFDHIKFGRKEPLSFQKGGPFKTVFGVVVGHDVSKEQRYKLGDYIFLSHHDDGSEIHDNHAFKISGILNPTGTAIDKTVFSSLSGIKAIHLESNDDDERHFTAQELKPDFVSAIFLGLHQKNRLFTLREEIKNLKKEPLSAIIPGLVIAELWTSLSFLDSALFGISLLVLVISFLGLLIAFFLSMAQRQKELMVLRTIGANADQLQVLICSEIIIVTSIGVFLGLILSKLLSFLLSPIFEKSYGLILSFSWINPNDIIISLSIISFGFLLSFLPGYKAYKHSVKKGMH